MDSLFFLLGGFTACAVVIFFAGRRLSYYGDLLAIKTGWGKAWVGLILLASVTSLPELVVGISASAIIQSADLAVGDILGSCAFNLGILAMLDAFVPKNRHIFGVASQGHVMAAAFGIILLAMVGVGLFFRKDVILISWIGLSSVIFIVTYLIAIRVIYLNEKRLNPATVEIIHSEDPDKKGLSMKQIIFWYSVFALVIVITGLALPYFAEGIAAKTGLGTSFVGTLFLAASTSLPEVAVSLAAIRMGAIDLAVGNLLGSNIFNILILAIDDIFYTPGPILKHASASNIVSVFSTILMSAIVIIGLSFRAEGKRYLLAWDAALIFLIYVINLIALYHL